MMKAQKLLREFLEDQRHNQKEIRIEHRFDLQSLNALELGSLYVFCAFLNLTLKSLEEEHWLQTHRLQEHQRAFDSFLAVAFQRELAPISFLQTVFENAVAADFRKMQKSVARLETLCISHIRKMNLDSFRELVRTVALEIDGWTQFEKDLEVSRLTAGNLHEERLSKVNSSERTWPFSRTLPEENLLPNVLHRAFDGMDEILEIDYNRDLGMKTDLRNHERLFEGAGAGVQSSYYTILTALKQAAPKPGSRFIDLGSGYGRVGLAVGLIRPDLEVLGYEYVGHRVEAAQASAQRAGLSDNVHFIEQDLSKQEFEIPDAEVYYLYDPFREETYRHVWNQLEALGQRKSIAIATKGNAGAWFSKAVKNKSWSQPEIHDTGNLLLFRSLPKQK